MRKWLLSECQADPALDQAFTAGDELGDEPPKPSPLPRAMKVWITGIPVHATHEVWLYRGLFLCIKCGAMGSSKPRLLRQACPLLPIASGPKAITRFRQGKLPWGLAHWPEDTGLYRGVEAMWKRFGGRRVAI